MKPFNIFRAGRHTASCGTALSFDEGMLKASVAAYDPTLHEAPIVVGHPAENGPAFGWVRGLSFAEGQLHAEPHQVNPEFEALVQAGTYKKVSASFYSPDAPTNPVPGTWYLRHVGFLGAQPPAVKGLAAIGFAEAEEGVVAFGDTNDYVSATVLRNLREWLLGRFGKDDADAVVPSYLAEEMEAASRATPEATPESTPVSTPDPDHPLYAEPEEPTMSPEQLAAAEAALQAEQAALKAEQSALQAEQAAFAERELRIKATEQAQRLAGIGDRVEKLVTEGRVLPAEKPRLVAFMASLADDAVVSFSEDGQALEIGAGELLMGILTQLPPRVAFGEVAPGDPGAPAELDSADLAARAVAYRESQLAAGITLTTSQAVAAVQAGH